MTELCVGCLGWFFFFFKQKTAYELRISDWSSDVCSSDLGDRSHESATVVADAPEKIGGEIRSVALFGDPLPDAEAEAFIVGARHEVDDARHRVGAVDRRRAVLEHIGTRQRRKDRKSTRLNSSH